MFVYTYSIPSEEAILDRLLSWVWYIIFGPKYRLTLDSGHGLELYLYFTKSWSRNKPWWSLVKRIIRLLVRRCVVWTPKGCEFSLGGNETWCDVNDMYLFVINTNTRTLPFIVIFRLQFYRAIPRDRENQPCFEEISRRSITFSIFGYGSIWYLVMNLLIWINTVLKFWAFVFSFFCFLTREASAQKFEGLAPHHNSMIYRYS